VRKCGLGILQKSCISTDRILAYARSPSNTGAVGVGSFDYLFSFYGLLLGIAVANVAIGFADMWRDCEKIEVGTCPPLVASSVLLGGMNVWMQMWLARPYATVNGIQMLAAAAISLPYVFVSRAIFPGQEDKPERSLEEHYLKHRKIILILLALPSATSVTSHVVLDHFRYKPWEIWWSAARVALPLMLLFFPQRRAQRTGLAALNLTQLIGLFR
jgi:hypothetical protein